MGRYVKLYIATHLRHSDMDLSFSIPVIGKVALSTHKRHSLHISEWQHSNRKRPAVLTNQLALPANFGHTGGDPSKGNH